MTRDFLSSELLSLRLRHNLTQKEIAKKLNLSESTWIRYETGKREPDASELLRIYSTLGESIEKPMLRAAHPEQYATEDASTEEKRDAIASYVKNVLPSFAVNQLFALMFSNKINFIQRLQEWTLEIHLPRELHSIKTKFSTMLFDFASDRNEIVLPDEPMPDRDIMLEDILDQK